MCGLEDLVLPTGSDENGDNCTISLDGEGHVDHPAHPGSADGEDGFFPLSSPFQLFMKASMNLVLT